MVQKHLFSRTLSVFLLTVCLCSATGCGQAIESFFAEQQTQYEQGLHDSPKYQDFLTPVSGADNLYELYHTDFSGMPYNNLEPFGDNILLVGEATYDDFGSSYSGDSEPEYEFSFDVYSPWSNRILATLPHTEISCDRYQVLGNRLLLINDAAMELSVYNSSLHLVNTYDISGLYDDCPPTFFAGESNSELYTYNNTDNTILCLTMTQEELSVQDTFESPYYSTVICDSSTQSRQLLISGIDPVTLAYTTAVLDMNTLSPVLTLPGSSYFCGDMSATAIVAGTNDYEYYWAYQQLDGTPSYFRLSNGQDVTLLADGSMIFLQEDFDTAVSHYPVSYYHYSPTGEMLSSFTYDCGDLNTDSGIYLSSGLAYFEELQTCFILAYDMNCRPYLLVWDLEQNAGSGDALSFYADEEELALHTPSTYWEDYSDMFGEPYGDTVTLIEDPASYDWGELTDANARASELEEQYGISIYLGPEVPDMIDCFYTSQENDPAVLNSALNDLSDVLSCYPENFFSQLCFRDNRGIRIYLTGTISGDTDGMLDEPSGFVNEINSYMVMVLDTGYSWDWDYTINHEFSHMIDRRLEFRSTVVEDPLYSEDTWSSYNPADCPYLDSYDGYEEYTAYEQFSEYYVDSYSLTYATEDRAELFGTAMSDYLNSFKEDEIFEGTRPTAEKYRYYCECIRDGFDTTGWEEVMPWEMILN